MKIGKYLKNLFINMPLYLHIFFLIQLQIVTKNFEKIHRSKKKISLIHSENTHYQLQFAGAMVTIATPYLLHFTCLWVIEDFINLFHLSIFCCLECI